MSEPISDFLIIGAGVIGMMLARELSDSGASVTIVDRQEAGHESSWAGGGIVSPLYPWRYKEPVTQLATWSQSSYVHLSEILREETGCDPELRQKGMFMVSVEDADEALLWAERFHRPMRNVTAEFLYQQEPNLAKGFQRALWMPEVSSIRNPRLGRALKLSLLQRSNVQLLEHTPVDQFLLQAERVVGIRSGSTEIRAGHTVVAAGAWSGQLLQSLSVSLPVEPVHGQMMVFKAEPGLMNRVVLLDGRYLIPRNDGRILVGSTLERIGFNKRTTEESRDSLHQTALRILPALAELEVEHHWAGLRPGSPEGIPFIGPLPGYQGLDVNAGHFRNGLVLAPASTRMHADLLLGRDPVVDAKPYRLEGRLS